MTIDNWIQRMVTSELLWIRSWYADGLFRQRVTGIVRERLAPVSTGPHCHGLRDLTLARLQALGGELQTLLDRATDAERAEPWFGYALITEREVHAEIALRARKAAS